MCDGPLVTNGVASGLSFRGNRCVECSRPKPMHESDLHRWLGESLR